MKPILISTLVIALLAASACAQGTFSVTGTPIPSALLEANYAKMPSGVSAYDLNICNSSAQKESIVSSEIYQVMAQQNAGFQPIGREIILAALLKSQNRSVMGIINLSLASATGALSVLGSSKAIPVGAITGTGIASLSLQQVMSGLKPAFPTMTLQQFDSQVLEPALVLDSGSCVERTVFTIATSAASRKTPLPALSFHIR